MSIGLFAMGEAALSAFAAMPEPAGVKVPPKRRVAAKRDADTAPEPR